MNKRKVLSLMLVSGMVLSVSSAAFADELVDTSTEAVASSTVDSGGNNLGDNTNTVPSTDNNNSDLVNTDDTPAPSTVDSGGNNLGDSANTVPSTDNNNSELVNTVDVAKPSTESSVEPSTDNLGDKGNTVPSIDNSSAGIVTEPKQDDKLKKEEKKADVAGEPVKQSDTKPKEEPVITNPIITPVETKTGDTIVGTQNGEVLVQKVDGSTQLQKAETVGGQLQADGTIKVQDKEGKMKTLPHTGEKESGMMLALGVVILGFLGYWKFGVQIKEWFKKFKK
ncbi:LPXTG cell wall anchor domain-containing protein [Streptococcus sp. 20-1249]|uniref:LPXTG cell wall anchor domain-containing protein n=1 Tax=Streptococcus hepaticus TaxID=3349163 RepID=UPI0037494E2E